MRLTDSKLLYSRRYPLIPCKKEVFPPRVPKPVESGEKYWRIVDEKSVFVPRPECEGPARQFIALAKELSRSYEIDIDIRQKAYYVEVDLHLYCSVYPRELTFMIARLITMSDRMSSFIFPKEPSDFTLSLEFDTHDYYLDGKLIND